MLSGFVLEDEWTSGSICRFTNSYGSRRPKVYRPMYIGPEMTGGARAGYNLRFQVQRGCIIMQI